MTLEVSRISRLAPTGPSLRRSPHFEVRCDEGTVRSSCGNSFCGGRSVLANPFEEGVFWTRVFVRSLFVRERERVPCGVRLAVRVL